MGVWRNSEFISRVKESKCGEGGRAWEEGEEQREGRSEGATDERRGKSKKRQGVQSKTSPCGCGGRYPVMEGDKFSGRINSSETKLTFFPPVRFVQLFFLISYFSTNCPAPDGFSLSLWYFPLAHSVLFADCMFSLGFGALQRLCGSLRLPFVRPVPLFYNSRFCHFTSLLIILSPQPFPSCFLCVLDSFSFVFYASFW